MMSKVDYIDFQSRTQPLAYLITFPVVWNVATR